ncbi:MAG: lytic transglycosylase domain-containing protein [Acidobacteriota bacterium]
MKVFILILAVLSCGSLRAGGFYSYVDENGVKVLTNLGSGRRAVPSEAQSKAEPSQNFAPLISSYAREYGVNPDLVSAIIRVESNFDPRAVSPKDCRGLMQLHPETARRYGVSDVFDPAENIEAGVKFLSYLTDSFDRNLDLILAAYNAGENAVRRHKGIPPYAETRDYVTRVKSIFGHDSLDPKPVRRPRRIFRMVSDDGEVILTNTPTLVSEQAAARTEPATR